MTKEVTFTFQHKYCDGTRVSTVTVIPGESIYCVTNDECLSETKRVKWAVLGMGLWIAERLLVNTWLQRLPYAVREELGYVIAEAPKGVACDWIEDHGGNREWADMLSYADRPARELVTIERTFKVGDKARHGNLKYSIIPWANFGMIVAITEKTVTVVGKNGKARRSNIQDFCTRNFAIQTEAVV